MARQTSRAPWFPRSRRARSYTLFVVVLAGAWTVARLSRHGGGDLPRIAPRIGEIQGAAHRSPIANQRVRDVAGVVTAVIEKGFFLQDPEGDGDEATSDAVFVFTAHLPDVRPGDRVLVDGKVAEYYPGGKDTGNLSGTQIGWADVVVVSRGEPLPPPVEITCAAVDARRSGEALRSRRIPSGPVEDDARGPVDAPGVCFDPDSDVLDFFESLESMRVMVRDAVAVGPSSRRYGDVVIMPAACLGEEDRTERGGVLRTADNVHPARITVDDTALPGAPEARVGDRFGEITGVLDYGFGSFRLLNTQPLRLEDGGLQLGELAFDAAAGEIRVASYNVFNLGPRDEERRRSIAGHIAGGLGAPAIVAVEEMVDDSGPESDAVVSAERGFSLLVGAIARAGGPRYEFRQIDPPDGADGGLPGANIRVGFLFRPDRIAFLERFEGPAFARLPALAGRSFTEAGRLFAREATFASTRKPLLAAFRSGGRTLLAIAVHLRSKRGSEPLFGRRQPPEDRTLSPRLAQARMLASLVDRMRSGDPDVRVVVLGDFNDTQFSAPMRTLTASGLVNLGELSERSGGSALYTYIHRGLSQALDHVLVTPNLVRGARCGVLHVNAEFPRSASDHDPVLAVLRLE